MHKKILKLFKITGTKYFWGNYFDSRFYIGSLISKKKTNTILDIGCGCGIFLHLSNADRKIGLDLSLESLHNAKKLEPTMDLICGDATNLPFKDDFFTYIIAVQILAELKKSNLDWKKGMNETIRVAKKNNSEIIFSGNNRASRHFEKYDLKSRKKYLTCNEQLEILNDKYSVIAEGYDPHSKVIMFILKKIFYNIPEKIIEGLYIEKILHRLLRSKRFLKNGRSYIIQCKIKNK